MYSKSSKKDDLKIHRIRTSKNCITTMESLCPLCSGKLLLVEDELVCESCGYVIQNSIQVPASTGHGSYLSTKLISSYELGSYVGPPKLSSKDSAFSGIGGGQSNIKYLKMVSDYGLKSSRDYKEHSCIRIISRISDRLELPETVSIYAFDLSRGFLDVRSKVRSISIPAICLYSLIVSCKKFCINKVNTKRLIQVFRELGYRISLSSIVKVSTAVDVPLPSKLSEDCLLTIIPTVVSNPIVKEKIKEHYLSSVEYERKLYRTIISILAHLDKYKKFGHSPYTLAATSAYAGEIALSKIERRNPMFSQRVVSKSADVAEYTIREQYGKLFRDAVLSFLSQIDC